MLHHHPVDDLYFSEELSSPAETFASYSYSREIIKSIAVACSTARGMIRRRGTVKINRETVVFSQPGRLTVILPWPVIPAETPPMQFMTKKVVVHFVPLFSWPIVVGAAGASTVGLAYPETDTVFIRVNDVLTPDDMADPNKEADRVAIELMDVVTVGLGRAASPMLMTLLHELTHLLDIARQRAEKGEPAAYKRLKAFPITDDRKRLINYGDERSALMSELIAAYSAFLATHRRVMRRPFAKTAGDNANPHVYTFDEGIISNARLSVEAFLSKVKNTRNPNAVLLYEPLLKPEARKRAAARLVAMHAELIARLLTEPVPL